MRIIAILLFFYLSSFTNFNLTAKKDILTELEFARLNEQADDIKSMTYNGERDFLYRKVEGAKRNKIKILKRA